MQDEKVVGIIRRMRHDFGNHLQVILGYLELERPREVKDYIHSLIDEMQAERAIFEHLPEQVALYLYQQVLMAADLGLILHFRELKITSCELLQMNNEPVTTLRRIGPVLQSNDEEPLVEVSLFGGEGEMVMVINSQHLETSPLSVSIRE